MLSHKSNAMAVKRVRIMCRGEWGGGGGLLSHKSNAMAVKRVRDNVFAGHRLFSHNDIRYLMCLMWGKTW